MTKTADELCVNTTVEQGATLGWARYVGRHGHSIGMETFGASAPLKELQTKFGFVAEEVGVVWELPGDRAAALERAEQQPDHQRSAREPEPERPCARDRHGTSPSRTPATSPRLNAATSISERCRYESPK
jgi:hypothetical protein